MSSPSSIVSSPSSSTPLEDTTTNGHVPVDHSVGGTSGVFAVPAVMMIMILCKFNTCHTAAVCGGDVHGLVYV